VDLGAFADALDKLADELENCPRAIAEKFAPELLEAFSGYTPKLTGALADSEGTEVGGSGVTFRTHLPLYASFRNYGGDIEPRHTITRTRFNKKTKQMETVVELGFLHWDGVFARHVHQEGAYYLEKTISWADGALPGVMEEVVQEIFDDSGL
jgi:hypothetical protein